MGEQEEEQQSGGRQPAGGGAYHSMAHVLLQQLDTGQPVGGGHDGQ